MSPAPPLPPVAESLMSPALGLTKVRPARAGADVNNEDTPRWWEGTKACTERPDLPSKRPTTRQAGPAPQGGVVLGRRLRGMVS